MGRIGSTVVSVAAAAAVDIDTVLCAQDNVAAIDNKAVVCQHLVFKQILFKLGICGLACAIGVTGNNPAVVGIGKQYADVRCGRSACILYRNEGILLQLDGAFNIACALNADDIAVVGCIHCIIYAVVICQAGALVENQSAIVVHQRCSHINAVCNGELCVGAGVCDGAGVTVNGDVLES